VNDVRLAAIRVPGSVEPWTGVGFAADGDAISFDNGALSVGADDCSLVIAGPALARSDLEGIVLDHGDLMPSGRHPNGAVEFDHVVVMTDSLERTSAAIEEVLGLEQRRVRDTGAVRQAFHRFGDVDVARGCIVEVVQRPDVERTAVWGVVVIVEDIDTAVAAADGLIAQPKEAVQAGRRIATVSRAAGLPLAVALMTR